MAWSLHHQVKKTEANRKDTQESTLEGLGILGRSIGHSLLSLLASEASLS